MNTRGSVRKRLIGLLRKPRKVNELQKELNVSPGTISYHLKKLRDQDIVEVVKEKKQGGPTIYSLKKKEDFKGNKRLLSYLRMLEQLNQRKEGMEFEEFTYFEDNEIDDWIDWAQDFNGTGFVSTKFHLTKQGKEFLEKNKKKNSKIKSQLSEMNKEIKSPDKGN